MLIMIEQLEQTIGNYERRIGRSSLSKEELAIQRDFLRGIKLDLSRRKEQYKRASAVLIGGKIEALKK
jgi:hypothetical protein